MYKKILASVLAVTLVTGAGIAANSSSQADLPYSLSISAAAENKLTYHSFTYEIINDSSVRITGYIGDKNATEIEIPETVNGKIVTNIKAYAFYNMPKLKSVKLSAGVKAIGSYAFGYIADENSKPKKLSGFTLECYKDSAGVTYAKKNSIKYTLRHVHCFDTWKVTKEPTCTERGEGLLTCSGCGESHIQYIQSGHRYKTKKVASTYTAKGYTLHTCANCGSSYKTDYTALLKLGTVKGGKQSSTLNTASLSWNNVTGATGYAVYRYDYTKKAWVKVKKVSANSCTISGLKSSSVYKYSVKAYHQDGTKYALGGRSATITVVTKPAKPTLTVSGGGGYVNLSWTKVSGATGYELYYSTKAKSGYKLLKRTAVNSFTKSGLTGGKKYYFAVKAYKKSGTVVARSDTDYKSATILLSGKKILNSVVIGQYGGKIAGYAACGPTSATMLVNSEKGANWDKDDLILYSEKHKLNDQGSLRTNGGMTAPNLVNLINNYLGGKYNARNIYNYNVAQTLKNQIDNNHRAIVVAQYSSSIVTYYGSATHFVLITGYEYINGQLYFYYGDPYFGNGYQPLKSVSASTLETSVNMVNIEPRAIIVLD